MSKESEDEKEIIEKLVHGVNFVISKYENGKITFDDTCIILREIAKRFERRLGRCIVIEIEQKMIDVIGYIK